MGTPEPAVATLQALDALGVELVVCTQPDRARGRSRALVAPPVKEAAVAMGWPVVQPHIRQEVRDTVAAAGSYDVGVVVAYGMILDAATLALPAAGLLNVHFSLLPRWRGAAPVERAILAGDDITGVTIMSMDEGLDTGPVVASNATPIGVHETAGQLTTRLADIGAELLVHTLPGWVDGSVKAEAQVDAESTYAGRLTTEEAKLDFGEPAATLARRVRAFNPRPGAWALHDDRLKIYAAVPVSSPGLTPGQLLIADDGVVVGTGSDGLALLTVQPAGRQPMSALEWARGLRPGSAETLQ